MGLLKSAPSGSPFWRSVLPLKDDSEAVRLTSARVPGHSLSVVRWWGGAAMEGKHNTDPTIVRAWGRRDNAVRRDEKNDSPFLIVMIPRDEATAQHGKGWVLTAARRSLPLLLPLFLVQRG